MKKKIVHYIYTHDMAYKICRPLSFVYSFFLMWIVSWLCLSVIVLAPVMLFRPTDMLISQIAYITAVISGLMVANLMPKAIENTKDKRAKYLQGLGE